ncbi:MAG: GNAT family N-acetyltransferase [Algoriphagus aquaeductus]|uniref:GNAT family N-acetyltransferase n=1 Tax=Algoriphagus aquaeductus TaxID=475299 RepID=UPI00387A3ABD
MNPEISFRKAQEEDKDSLWQLIQPIIRKGGTYVFDPQISEESMMKYWLNSDKKTFVAESDGEILGTFYIKPNQPDLGNHICNAGFMVSEKASGKGLGKAMGKFALGEARRLGYLGMQFNFVIKTNENAVKLWKSLGFEVIGEIPEAYRHPQLGLVPALIMYQKL